jgi:pseudouridine-5'-phosphate glycosidase
VAIHAGRFLIGLDDAALEALARAPAGSVLKAARPSLAAALVGGGWAATTVSATMIAAQAAGIRVFATGGIGGVHRNASTSFDESADLGILGSCRITVVSGGVKSILDIRATLERLETLGVTVLVFGTHRFPAFWLTDSGYTVDFSVTSPEEIADVMQAADALALPRGILVANPLAETAQLDPALHDRLLTDALQAAEDATVRGKDITPFLLDYIHQHTDQTSVAVNLEIVRGNCKLGADIARSWSALQSEDHRL